MEFISKHKLEFEVSEDPFFGTLFRIGTCEGMWGFTGDSYYILSIVNNEPGNGHLDDVFEWFENSCKRDNKNFLVLESFNGRFYDYLLREKGFIALDKDKDNCIKVFNKKAYKKLLKQGNKMLKPGSLKCK